MGSSPPAPYRQPNLASRAYLGTVSSSEIERLHATNAELQRRVDAAEAEIDALRADALARRAEVRRLAESLPAAMSRRALLADMVRSGRRRRNV